MQLPPSLQIAEDLDLLKNLQYLLDPSFRYAIEIRHRSWFNELFYNYLKERNYCLVWNQLDTLITPPVVTTNFIYLRLIGDRSIDERDFGKIKKDRTKEMQLWANIIKDCGNTFCYLHLDTIYILLTFYHIITYIIQKMIPTRLIQQQLYN